MFQLEFTDKNKKFYCIGLFSGKVASNEDFKIKFLRRNFKLNYVFYFPQVADVAFVSKNDIRLMLPKPETKKGTKRTQSFITFDVNFFGIDVQ